jgi:hypothetical protein
MIEDIFGDTGTIDLNVGSFERVHRIRDGSAILLCYPALLVELASDALSAMFFMYVSKFGRFMLIQFPAETKLTNSTSRWRNFDTQDHTHHASNSTLATASSLTVYFILYIISRLYQP